MQLLALLTAGGGRFQEMLSKAVAVPNNAAPATDEGFGFEAFKREMMAAMEWARRCRDRWMAWGQVSSAPVPQEGACDADGPKERLVTAAPDATTRGEASTALPPIALASTSVEKVDAHTPKSDSAASVLEAPSGYAHSFLRRRGVKDLFARLAASQFGTATTERDRAGDGRAQTASVILDAIRACQMIG